jgi:HAE1 family hydrophobic/amphiphilic exporter-1
VPLVTATGAGANARISSGLAVFSGMIASICLAVLFVPSFFTVAARFEERGKTTKVVPKEAAAGTSPLTKHWSPRRGIP